MDRICENCGTHFQIAPSRVKRGGGKFCQISCYGEHQQKSPHTARGKVALPSIERVCEQCGKSFMTSATRPKRNCSRPCLSASNRVSKICATCGKEFSSPRSTAARVINCSEECKHAAAEYIPCKACGAIFRVARPGHTHCSEDCRRPPEVIACLTCGKESRVVPSARQRFCSVGCYRRHMGETEPEMNVRLALEELREVFIQEESIPGWRGPVDFLLPNIKLALEVDEPYWHDKVADRDARKDLHMQSHGLTVVRLVATPFYGDLTDQMVSAVKAAIGIASSAPTASSIEALYPIQLSLPSELGL